MNSIKSAINNKTLSIKTNGYIVLSNSILFVLDKYKILFIILINTF
jgi:hypothetical protein